jgi:hypothetical protein
LEVGLKDRLQDELERPLQTPLSSCPCLPD